MYIYRLFRLRSVTIKILQYKRMGSPTICFRDCSFHNPVHEPIAEASHQQLFFFLLVPNFGIGGFRSILWALWTLYHIESSTEISTPSITGLGQVRVVNAQIVKIKV